MAEVETLKNKHSYLFLSVVRAAARHAVAVSSGVRTQIKPTITRNPADGVWVIFCWGGISMIVTDNGESFKAAAQWIAQKWRICHITISALIRLQCV